MKTKIFVLLMVVLVSGLLLPLASNAITVSPPLIEIDANRGDVINQVLKVRNEEAVPVTYYLSAERFVASGEQGEPQFVGEDVGLATWIKFNVDSIVVPAGQTIEVPFSINVPNYAGPGGQYAAIFLSTLPPSAAKGGSQVTIASKIGTLVLVKIAGEIKESAQVAEFSAGSGSYLALPANFKIRVENNGNIHVKPMGTILIKNAFGSVAGEVKVNDNGGNVLPEQTRKFESAWVKNANATGATTFWGKYRQEKENYAFGKYSADLTLAYGTAGRVLNAKTSFWVIPWHILIVNLIVLVIIVVILYFLLKQYNAYIVKKYSGSKKK